MKQINDKNSQATTFIELITTYQRPLYAYIVSVIGNFNDADDILQETTRTMWEKFSQFTIGTDFLAWGRKIAYYRIQEYRARKKKDPRLFTQSIFDSLDKKAEQKLTGLHSYSDFLEKCLRKLNDSDINLVTGIYANRHSVKELSTQLNRSTQSLYRSLGRIHDLLRKCIQTKVGREERQ